MQPCPSSSVSRKRAYRPSRPIAAVGVVIVALLWACLLATTPTGVEALTPINMCGSSGGVFNTDGAVNEAIGPACTVTSPTIGPVRDATFTFSDASVVGRLLITGVVTNVSITIRGGTVTNANGDAIAVTSPNATGLSMLLTDDVAVAAGPAAVKLAALRVDGAVLQRLNVSVVRASLSAHGQEASSFAVRSGPLVESHIRLDRVNATAVGSAGPGTSLEFTGSGLQGSSLVVANCDLQANATLDAASVLFATGSPITDGSHVRFEHTRMVASADGSTRTFLLAAGSSLVDSEVSFFNVTANATAGSGVSRTVAMTDGSRIRDGGRLILSHVVATCTGHTDATSILFDTDSGLVNNGSIGVSGGRLESRSVTSSSYSIRLKDRSPIVNGSAVVVDAGTTLLTVGAVDSLTWVSTSNSGVANGSKIHFVGVSATATAGTGMSSAFRFVGFSGLHDDSRLVITGGNFEVLSTNGANVAGVWFDTDASVTQASSVRCVDALFRVHAAGYARLYYHELRSAVNDSEVTFTNVTANVTVDTGNAAGFGWERQSGLTNSTVSIHGGRYDTASKSGAAVSIVFYHKTSVTRGSVLNVSDVAFAAVGATFVRTMELFEDCAVAANSRVVLENVTATATAGTSSCRSLLFNTRSSIVHGSSVRVLGGHYACDSTGGEAGSLYFVAQSSVDGNGSTFEVATGTVLVAIAADEARTLTLSDRCEVRDGGRLLLSDVNATSAGINGSHTILLRRSSTVTSNGTIDISGGAFDSRSAGADAFSIHFSDRATVDGGSLFSVSNTSLTAFGQVYGRTLDMVLESRVTGGSKIRFADVVANVTAATQNSISFLIQVGSGIYNDSAFSVVGGRYESHAWARDGTSVFFHKDARVTGGSLFALSHGTVLASTSSTRKARTVVLSLSCRVEDGSRLLLYDVNATAESELESATVLIDTFSSVTNNGTIDISGGTFNSRSAAGAGRSIHFTDHAAIGGGSLFSVSNTTLTTIGQVYARTLLMHADSGVNGRGSVLRFTHVTANATSATETCVSFLFNIRSGVYDHGLFQIVGGRFDCHGATEDGRSVHFSNAQITGGGTLELSHGAVLAATSATRFARSVTVSTYSAVDAGGRLVLTDVDATAEGRMGSTSILVDTLSNVSRNGTITVTGGRLASRSVVGASQNVVFSDSVVTDSSLFSINGTTLTAAAQTFARTFHMGGAPVANHSRVLLTDVNATATAVTSSRSLFWASNSGLVNGSTFAVSGGTFASHSSSQIGDSIYLADFASIASGSLFTVSNATFVATGNTHAHTFEMTANSWIMDNSHVAFTDVRAEAIAQGGNATSMYFHDDSGVRDGSSIAVSGGRFDAVSPAGISCSLWLDPSSPVTRDSRVVLTGVTLNATSWSTARSVFINGGVRLGSRVDLVDVVASALSTSLHSFSMDVREAAGIRDNGTVRFSGGRYTSTSQTAYAYSVFFGPTTVANGSLIEISGATTLNATGDTHARTLMFSKATIADHSRVLLEGVDATATATHTSSISVSFHTDARIERSSSLRIEGGRFVSTCGSAFSYSVYFKDNSSISDNSTVDVVGASLRSIGGSYARTVAAAKGSGIVDYSRVSLVDVTAYTAGGGMGGAVSVIWATWSDIRNHSALRIVGGSFESRAASVYSGGMWLDRDVAVADGSVLEVADATFVSAAQDYSRFFATTERCAVVDGSLLTFRNVSSSVFGFDNEAASFAFLGTAVGLNATVRVSGGWYESRSVAAHSYSMLFGPNSAIRHDATIDVRDASLSSDGGSYSRSLMFHLTGLSDRSRLLLTNVNAASLARNSSSVSLYWLRDSGVHNGSAVRINGGRFESRTLQSDGGAYNLLLSTTSPIANGSAVSVTNTTFVAEALGTGGSATFVTSALSPITDSELSFTDVNATSRAANSSTMPAYTFLWYDRSGLVNATVRITNGVFECRTERQQNSSSLHFTRSSPITKGSLVEVAGATFVSQAAVSGSASTFERHTDSPMGDGSRAIFRRVNATALATTGASTSIYAVQRSGLGSDSSVVMTGCTFSSRSIHGASRSLLFMDSSGVDGGSSITVESTQLTSHGATGSTTLLLEHQSAVSNASRIELVNVTAQSTAEAGESTSLFVTGNSGIRNGSSVRITGGTFSSHSPADSSISLNVVASPFSSGSALDVRDVVLTSTAASTSNTVVFFDGAAVSDSRLTFTNVTASANSTTAGGSASFLFQTLSPLTNASLTVSGGAYTADAAGGSSHNFAFEDRSPPRDGSTLRVDGASLTSAGLNAARLAAFTDDPIVASSATFVNVNATTTSATARCVSLFVKRGSGFASGGSLHVLGGFYRSRSLARDSFGLFFDNGASLVGGVVAVTSATFTTHAATYARTVQFHDGSRVAQRSVLSLTNTTASCVADGGSCVVVLMSAASTLDDGSALVINGGTYEMSASNDGEVYVMLFSGEANITNGSTVAVGGGGRFVGTGAAGAYLFAARSSAVDRAQVTWRNFSAELNAAKAVEAVSFDVASAASLLRSAVVIAAAELRTSSSNTTTPAPQAPRLLSLPTATDAATSITLAQIHWEVASSSSVAAAALIAIPVVASSSSSGAVQPRRVMPLPGTLNVSDVTADPTWPSQPAVGLLVLSVLSAADAALVTRSSSENPYTCRLAFANVRLVSAGWGALVSAVNASSTPPAPVTAPTSFLQPVAAGMGIAMALVDVRFDGPDIVTPARPPFAADAALLSAAFPTRTCAITGCNRWNGSVSGVVPWITADGAVCPTVASGDTTAALALPRHRCDTATSTESASSTLTTTAESPTSSFTRVTATSTLTSPTAAVVPETATLTVQLADPVSVSPTLRDARTVAVATVVTAEATTTVVAGSTGTVTTVGQISRLSSLRGALVCRDADHDDDEEEEVSVSQHPLRFPIPAAGRAVQHHAGAVAGSMVILFGVTALVCGVVAPLRWQIKSVRRQEASAATEGVRKPKTFASALAWCRFPGLLTILFSLVAPRITAAATVVFLGAAAGKASAAGVAIAALGCVLVAAALVATMAFHRAYFWRHVVAEAQQGDDGGPAESGSAQRTATAADAAAAAVVASRERLARLVDGADFEWAARDPAQTDNVMRAFGFYFDAYSRRAPWFMVFEVAAAVLSAALEELQERVGCLWSAWLVILVVLVYAAALLVLGPHRVVTDRWIYTGLALYQAACGVAVGLTQATADGTSQRDTAESAAQWLLSLGAVLTVFAAGYEVFKVVYMQCVVHWRKLDAQRRAQAVAAAEEMQPHLLLLHDTGVDEPLLDTSLVPVADDERSPIPQALSSDDADDGGGGDAALLARLLDDDDNVDNGAPTPPDDLLLSELLAMDASGGRQADVILSRRQQMHNALREALHTGHVGAADVDNAFRDDDEDALGALLPPPPGLLGPWSLEDSNAFGTASLPPPPLPASGAPTSLRRHPSA